MFDFKRAASKKEMIPSEAQSKIELALQEIDGLSKQAGYPKPIERVPEQGKFLRLGSHKVTGKELNAAVAQIDESFIQMNDVQIKALHHISQLYQAIGALDEEHIAGILTAIKAAETATDLAHINDENIGKIINYLMQDDQVLAHKNAQESRIAALENRIKTAYLVAGSAAVVALVSLVLCLSVLL